MATDALKLLTCYRLGTIIGLCRLIFRGIAFTGDNGFGRRGAVDDRSSSNNGSEMKNGRATPS